jgi:hypothetical protein
MVSLGLKIIRFAPLHIPFEFSQTDEYAELKIYGSQQLAKKKLPVRKSKRHTKADSSEKGKKTRSNKADKELKSVFNKIKKSKLILPVYAFCPGPTVPAPTFVCGPIGPIPTLSYTSPGCMGC